MSRKSAMYRTISQIQPNDKLYLWDGVNAKTEIQKYIFTYTGIYI